MHQPQRQPQPEELHLCVERGGHLVWAPALDAAQRASLCGAAWGLSMAFRGDTVRVQDYLPGLHLDVRALRPPEPLAPGPVPQPYPKRQALLDWDRLERAVWHALHGSWNDEAILVADEEVRCLVRQQGTVHDVGPSVAFTLRCHWPGIPGGGLPTAGQIS